MAFMVSVVSVAFVRQLPSTKQQEQEREEHDEDVILRFTSAF